MSEKKDYRGLYSFDKTTTLPLRGLLALLILSHHLGQRTEVYLLSGFTSGIGLQIVAVFFFISGYGLCVSYLTRRESYIDGFLNKRMGKLLPKFLLLTIGMIVAYQLCSSMDLEKQMQNMASGWTPLPHSWFIYAIIYVYLSFYLCASIAQSPRVLGLLFAVLIIIYILVLSLGLHFPSYWYVTIFSVNAGYYVGLYEEKITAVMRRHKFLCYSTLAASLFVSFCIMAKVRYATIILQEVWILVQAISVYAVVRTLGFVQWKWLCNVGIFSLELYLIHGIPLMLGQRMGLAEWSLWIFTYAVSIPLAIFMNWSYDKLFNGRAVLKT